MRKPGFLRIGSELAREGIPAAEALDELSQLSALAEEVTGLVLRDALRRKASEFLAEQAARLDQAGVPDGLRPQARAAGLDV